MTLDEAQTQINEHLIIAGQTARPIWEVCGAICVAVQAIDERTRGGLPTGETIEVLKAKIASLNSLLNNDAVIFDKIKAALGAPNATAAELPGIITAWRT